MEAIDLAAQVRKECKKGPARRFRQKGLVPAIFYGRAVDNILLTVKSDELAKLYKDRKEHGFIKLIIDDGNDKIEKLSLIKELQLQPLTGKFYHADFYEVDMKEKQTFEVSLQFTGKAVGVENGGELQHFKRNVKISCLPTILPNHIEVDITSLDIGDSIKVKELKLVDGITVLDTPDAAVVAVAAVKAEKGAAVEGTEAGTAAAAEKTAKEK
ncbi:MAG: 50S ribosomal protein L25/general stress protein Ctc [Syntrophaceae bacterium]|nr:50S ribosomal protein L25/general stress protein Ctc [Syntrophaceae bacterium]